MKHIYILFSTLLLCCLMTGCLKDPEIPGDIKNAKKPEVKTGQVETFTATTITLAAEVVRENGLPVMERGFCWALGADPFTVTDDNKTISGKGKGSFTATLTGLKPDSTYRVCAYARNGIGLTLGEERVVTTTKGLGQVETLKPQGVRASKAICGGIIRVPGEGEVLDRGIYLSLSPDPSAEDSVISSTMKTDSFTCELTDLEPLNTYYYTAYVENHFGVFYGEQQKFETGDGKPVVKINTEQSRIGFTDAEISAIVTSEGDAPVTLRGLCWGWDGIKEPTIENDTILCGSGEGAFTGLLIGLSAQTQYYVRAYATNKYGTSYSEETPAFFTKNDLPTIMTMPVTDMVDGTVKVGGGVLDEGMTVVTKFGICWGTRPEPTLADNVLLMTTDTAAFTGTIAQLKGETTYYVRTFATNKKGTAYDKNVQTFKTPSAFRLASPFPGEARDLAVGFTLNNQAYVLGGDMGASCTDELYGYNEMEATWKLFSSYGISVKRMSVCTSGNAAYAMGGISKENKISDQFYIYYRNEWTLLDADLTGSNIRSEASSFVQNDSLYLVGGMNNLGMCREIWRYDLNGSQKWKQVSDFPVAFRRGIALDIENTVYVGLGEVASNVNRGLWKRSDSRKDWTDVSGILPDKLGTVSTAVVYGNSIYMIDSNHVIWEYQRDDMSWKQRGTFPNGLSTYNMFVLNDTIYILSQNYYKSVFMTYHPLWDN